MKKTLFILAALTLTGCASSQVLMEHPHKTDIQPDVYECRNQAIHLANSMGMTMNPFLIQQEIETCLNHRGWVRVRR